MNNSAIFKKAHQIAKKTVCFVGDYRIAFSFALKQVFQELKSEFIVSTFSVYKGEKLPALKDDKIIKTNIVHGSFDGDFGCFVGDFELG